VAEGSRFLARPDLARKDLRFAGGAYRFAVAADAVDPHWFEDCQQEAWSHALPFLYEPGSSTVVPILVEAETPVPPGSPYGRGKGWTPYFRLFEDDGVGEQVKDVSVVKRPEGDLLQLTISWKGQEEDSDHGTYHLLAQGSGGAFVVRRFVTGPPAIRVAGDGTRR
jgi:hypothetical protein